MIHHVIGLNIVNLQNMQQCNEFLSNFVVTWELDLANKMNKDIFMLNSLKFKRPFLSALFPATAYLDYNGNMSPGIGTFSGKITLLYIMSFDQLQERTIGRSWDLTCLTQTPVKVWRLE